LCRILHVVGHFRERICHPQMSKQN
jgi:hypothetical protein